MRSTARPSRACGTSWRTLCISRGITMPRLAVIDTDARNAFSSGVHKRQYAITVTRGLMDTLNDDELSAVLAHELTHIENRDVQLLVIAAVFVGIISLAGDVIIRGPRFFLFNSFGGSGGGYRGGGWSGGKQWRRQPQQQLAERQERRRRRRRHHPHPDRRRDLPDRPPACHRAAPGHVAEA
ncbi:MAG: M48 family metalloprotease [Bauldia sp.]